MAPNGWSGPNGIDVGFVLQTVDSAGNALAMSMTGCSGLDYRWKSRSSVRQGNGGWQQRWTIYGAFTVIKSFFGAMTFVCVNRASIAPPSWSGTADGLAQSSACKVGHGIAINSRTWESGGVKAFEEVAEFIARQEPREVSEFI